MPLWIHNNLYLISEFQLSTLLPLQGSDGGFIPLSEVPDFTKIHDSLDNVVSQWVGNTAQISACLLNYASRQCHTV